MADVEPTIQVDARDMACPGPITEVARAYRKAKNGDIIEVLATDPGFTSDVRAWASATTNELVIVEEKDGVIRALLKITAKRQQGR